jgi:hypothetical protein
MREPREYEAPLCAQVGGDYWFPETGDDTDYDYSNLQVAKRICGNCAHRIECAEWGIHNERHGIWGGLTAQQLRIIRKRRGIVVRREEIA